MNSSERIFILFKLTSHQLELFFFIILDLLVHTDNCSKKACTPEVKGFYLNNKDDNL